MPGKGILSWYILKEHYQKSASVYSLHLKNEKQTYSTSLYTKCQYDKFNNVCFPTYISSSKFILTVVSNNIVMVCLHSIILCVLSVTAWTTIFLKATVAFSFYHGRCHCRDVITLTVLFEMTLLTVLVGFFLIKSNELIFIFLEKIMLS